ncbi:heme-binding protein [Streptomyces wedmorensis]|uniref:heme-binding protein n=1 Tax=Streptomyces wedmorensis TaxID=43759 RepID=UPI0005267FCA
MCARRAAGTRTGGTGYRPQDGFQSERTPSPQRLTLFLGGGAPVTAKGAPIAGIGVAGAPSGDLDEKFAQAGVASLAK